MPGMSPVSPPAGTPAPWSMHHLWSSPSRAPSSAPALRRASWAPCSHIPLGGIQGDLALLNQGAHLVLGVRMEEAVHLVAPTEVSVP